MICVSINEKQKENICNELSYLLKKYQCSKEVECIYFSSYINFSKELILQITIVGDYRLKKYYKVIREINNKYKQADSIDKFGFKVVIDIEDKYNYDISNSKKDINNLFNSTILYDKTGLYTSLKEEAVMLEANYDSKIFYYDNLVNINPKIGVKELIKSSQSSKNYKKI